MTTMPKSLDDRLQPKSEDDYLNDTYTIETDCVECGNTYTAKIPASGLYKYRMVRARVQEAFPDLTASDRELHFQSQVCNNCWSEMFVDGEEEEPTSSLLCEHRNLVNADEVNCDECDWCFNCESIQKFNNELCGNCGEMAGD